MDIPFVISVFKALGQVRELKNILGDVHLVDSKFNSLWMRKLKKKWRDDIF